MKLGPLNAAIRAAPKVRARFTFGPIRLDKGELQDALRSHYGPSKAAETGLTVTADGYLQWEQENHHG